jgi:hypothetical protein
MFVSTFELLVRPIAPPPFNSAVSRRAIQAYFLTIANLEPVGSPDVVLSLQFHATQALKNEETFTITDTGNGNIFGELTPDDATGKPSQKLTLPAGKTALFILQPDISKSAPNPASLEVANYEVRGFVNVEISPLSPSSTAKLLVSPQIRGTFVPNDLAAPNPDFDQQSYGLPTPNGGLITIP